MVKSSSFFGLKFESRCKKQNRISRYCNLIRIQHSGKMGWAIWTSRNGHHFRWKSTSLAVCLLLLLQASHPTVYYWIQNQIFFHNMLRYSTEMQTGPSLALDHDLKVVSSVYYKFLLYFRLFKLLSVFWTGSLSDAHGGWNGWYRVRSRLFASKIIRKSRYSTHNGHWQYFHSCFR